MRNSVLLVTEKQTVKADKLNLSWEDLFCNQLELFTKKTLEFSKFNLDFSEQKKYLKQQFEKLLLIANQTDKSFIGAVKAQQTKQIKGLENLEKRLLKAEKKYTQTNSKELSNYKMSFFQTKGYKNVEITFQNITMNMAKSSSINCSRNLNLWNLHLLL
jgi:hypothetical protein